MDFRETVATFKIYFRTSCTSKFKKGCTIGKLKRKKRDHEANQIKKKKEESPFDDAGKFREFGTKTRHRETKFTLLYWGSGVE